MSSEIPQKKRRKFASDKEAKEAEAARKKRYQQKRVYLGEAWEEWERQRILEGYKTASEWALHLLAVNEARCFHMPSQSSVGPDQTHDSTCEASTSGKQQYRLYQSFGSESGVREGEEEVLYVPPKQPGLYPGQPYVHETPVKPLERSERAISLPVTGTMTPSHETDPVTSPVLVVPRKNPKARLGMVTSTPSRVGKDPVTFSEYIEEGNLSGIEALDSDDCTEDEGSSEDDVQAAFDDPDWELPLSNSSANTKFGPDKVEVDEAISTQKCIAFMSSVFKLVEVAVGKTCCKCGEGLQFSTKMVGTCLVVSWRCPSNSSHHTGTWTSQPRTTGMFAGNILVPACLVLSGNSYTKVALMAKFLKLGFINKDSHYRIQRLYVYPAVQRYWTDMQESLLSGAASEPLVLAGDGRNDSPGYSAQYCTYSMMDVATGNILSLQVVDVREADGKSPNMEKIGFTRALSEIREKASVSEIVTDAHPQIKALMKNVHTDIIHQFDVWHMSKSLTKKLIAAAKQRGCGDIFHWVQPIRNHLWHCAQNCKGNEQHLKENWATVLHHVCNVHTWMATTYDLTEGHCDHPLPLPPSDTQKPWVQQDSPAHKALVKEVLSANLLRNLKYIRNFRHTSLLEHFHSTILMYCPKRSSFSYRGYIMRNILAAIDHNEHNNREPVKDKEGNVRLRHRYHKAASAWTAVPYKDSKKYLYIPGLLADILEEREYSVERMDAKPPAIPGDPASIRPNIAAKPKPSAECLAQAFYKRKGIGPSSAGSEK